MVRRPDPVEFDHPLAKDELQALARTLAMLSQPGLIDAYRRAHLACSMVGGSGATRGGDARNGYRVEADAGVGEAGTAQIK
jgi:hypothetical protein